MTFRPKRRLGQNFLRDRSVVAKILAAAELEPEDRVLEIGPGPGILTRELLPRCASLLAVEVDPELAGPLRREAPGKLEVVEGDVLRLDWDRLLAKPPYVLVANLPYQISGPVTARVLDFRDRFRRLVLMFQREVGQRLLAPPGTRDYGILSVLCQVWFRVSRVADVPPGAFSPPPKVHSVVLRFDPLVTPRVAIGDEALFRRLVRAAFAQRRKTLRNSLTGAGFPASWIDPALARTGIDGRRRGETLSLEEFAALSRGLEELSGRHGTQVSSETDFP